MALGSARILKTDAWAAHAARAFSVLMNCTVRIYSPADGDPTYVPATNSYTYGSETDHYTGVARVQVLRSAERSVAPGDDSETQVYQFQIPLASQFAIDDTMMVEITDGGLDENPPGPLYIIEHFNSGGSFEQTFYATVNSGR